MQPSRIASSSLSKRTNPRRLSTSLMTRNRLLKNYESCQSAFLGSSECSITTICQDPKASISSQDVLSSLPPGTPHNAVFTSLKYFTDKRSLSSLSTLPTASDMNPVATLTNLSMSKKLISEKNLEVMCLLQSLQNVVQTQRKLSLYHDSLKQKNKNGIVTASQSLTPWQEFDNNMDEIFDSTPTHVIVDEPVAEELIEQIEASKKWVDELSQAIKKQKKQSAIDLFYRDMPPKSSFLHILYTDDAMSIKSFFHTMLRFMNLMTGRLDIVFDVFLATQDFYSAFESHLKDQHNKGRNNIFDKDMINYLLNEQRSLEADQISNQLNDLKKCRELLLFRIVASFRLLEESRSSRKGAGGKIIMSQNYSRPTYTAMVRRLLYIIQYDIQDDPVLQHSLLPQLLTSLMLQKFCSTLDMDRMIKKIWNLSLISLENELKYVNFAERTNNDDVTYQVSNITAAFGTENLSEEGRVVNNAAKAMQLSEKDSHDEKNLRQWSKILSRYQSLLQYSSFRRQEEYPFVKLLDIVVSNGRRPKPELVMNILQNEYPYHDNLNVISLIQSIIHLQENKLPNDADYLMSPNTLQYITCSTSRKGHTDTITLLWDYLNLLRNNSNERHNPYSIYLQPTEGLYENIAATYAASHQRDHMVFGILAEMEEIGLNPSRNFLFRLSKSLRTHSSIRRIDLNLHTLRNKHYIDTYSNQTVSIKPTTSSLNTLLAALADLGFISKAMDVYNEFEDFGCAPDENTYSFLMNSIEMDITTTLPPITGQFETQVKDGEKVWIESRLDTANAVLDAAVDMGFGCDKHLVESYIKILLSAGAVEKAGDFLREKILKKEDISYHALGMIALANAKLGNKDDVVEIIQLSKLQGRKSLIPTHIMERIDGLLQK